MSEYVFFGRQHGKPFAALPIQQLIVLILAKQTKRKLNQRNKFLNKNAN